MHVPALEGFAHGTGPRKDDMFSAWEEFSVPVWALQ
jgi:hypothetical protein